MTLGTVIMRLSDPKNTSPIPYRDSKLTRLLQPALEGDSKINIICNISPCELSYEETLSTLKFAQRAKKIKQTISKNFVLDSKALIMKYEQEIQNLQRKLHEMEDRMAHEDSQEIPEEITHQLTLMQEEKEKADERMENLLQEKLMLQKELESWKSCIIHPEDVKSNKISGMDYDDVDLVSCRLSIGNIQKIKEEVSMINNRRSVEGFQKAYEEYVTGNFNPAMQADKNFRASILDKRRESMLIDNIDKIPEMLDRTPPFRLGESILTHNLEKIQEMLGETSPFASSLKGEIENNKDIHTDCFKIIDEQEIIIETLHRALSEKEDEIGVLKDELTLCRNNLAAMQRKLRKANK